jgi:hypothetical protein
MSRSACCAVRTLRRLNLYFDNTFLDLPTPPGCIPSLSFASCG